VSVALIGAAACSFLAIWCILVPPSALVRLRGLDGRGVGSRPGTGVGSPAGSAAGADDKHSTPPVAARPELTRPLAAGLCGLSIGLLLGGAIGLLVGLAVGAGIHRWLSGLETAAQRLEREQVQADLPLAAQLLAAAVSAGVAPGLAIDAVADALGGPLGERLRSGRRAEVLGVPPEGAWAGLLRDPTTRGLGRVLAQSSAIGLAPAAALLALAEDVQRETRLRADSAARSVGAKVAAPVGLCFLPAFVLCGIVPLIASTASTLLP